MPWYNSSSTVANFQARTRAGDRVRKRALAEKKIWVRLVRHDVRQVLLEVMRSERLAAYGLAIGLAPQVGLAQFNLREHFVAGRHTPDLRSAVCGGENLVVVVRRDKGSHGVVKGRGPHRVRLFAGQSKPPAGGRWRAPSSEF